MTQARTNLGPLTTPFTYPASCGVVVQDCATCQTGWQGQTCSDNRFNTQGVQDNVGCWPPRSPRETTTEIAVLGWGFYSPGVQCPVGYATACASTAGVEGGFPFQFSMLPQETVVGCCPTGYSCSYNPGYDQAQTCYKYYSTGSFPTVQCSSGTSNQFSYITIPATVTAPVTDASVPTTTVLQNVLVFAPLIQINWQSTDRPSSTALPGSSPTSSASASATAPNEPGGAATEARAGALSRGATIGIAVAAAVVGLALVAMFVFWMRWRRRRYQAVMPTLPPEPKTAAGRGEKQPHEIDTVYIAEAPTEPERYEMPG